jgi:hypothetical protein
VGWQLEGMRLFKNYFFQNRAITKKVILFRQSVRNSNVPCIAVSVYVIFFSHAPKDWIHLFFTYKYCLPKMDNCCGHFYLRNWFFQQWNLPSVAVGGKHSEAGHILFLRILYILSISRPQKGYYILSLSRQKKDMYRVQLSISGAVRKWQIWPLKPKISATERWKKDIGEDTDINMDIIFWNP